jgi:hypothetical protein
MGRYRLEAELFTNLPGAQRFRATDKILSRQAEVHLLTGAHTADAVDAARSAALVDDPRIVRIIDAGRYSSISFVLTAPLDGVSLADVGPLPAAQARAVAGEVATALAAAAAQDVHHLALRPELIFLGEGETVRIGGMAWDAAARGIADEDPVASSATDAKALVSILYAALTARWPGKVSSVMPQPPFWDANPVAPIELVSGVPGDLNTLCAVALAVGGVGPDTASQVVEDLGIWPTVRINLPYSASVRGPVPRQPAPPAPPADPDGLDDGQGATVGSDRSVDSAAAGTAGAGLAAGAQPFRPTDADVAALAAQAVIQDRLAAIEAIVVPANSDAEDTFRLSDYPRSGWADSFQTAEQAPPEDSLPPDGDLPADRDYDFFPAAGAEPGDELPPADSAEPIDELAPADESPLLKELSLVETVPPAQAFAGASESGPADRAAPVGELPPVDDAEPAGELSPVDDAEPADEPQLAAGPEPLDDLQPDEDSQPAEDSQRADEPEPKDDRRRTGNLDHVARLESMAQAARAIAAADDLDWLATPATPPPALSSLAEQLVPDEELEAEEPTWKVAPKRSVEPQEFTLAPLPDDLAEVLASVPPLDQSDHLYEPLVVGDVDDDATLVLEPVEEQEDWDDEFVYHDRPLNRAKLARPGTLAMPIGRDEVPPGPGDERVREVLDGAAEAAQPSPVDLLAGRDWRAAAVTPALAPEEPVQSWEPEPIIDEAAEVPGTGDTASDEFSVIGVATPAPGLAAPLALSEGRLFDAEAPTFDNVLPERPLAVEPEARNWWPIVTFIAVVVASLCLGLLILVLVDAINLGVPWNFGEQPAVGTLVATGW